MESATPATAAEAQADAHADAHAVPYLTYVKVWAVLIGLTLVTVLASMLELRHLAVFTALLVATVKASLVVLYFMHIRYERRLFAWMLIAILAMYAVFVILTFADYSFR